MTTPYKPTAAERTAISAAFGAIEYLASATNWNDSGQLAEALKLERKNLPGVLATGKVVEAWHKGASSPDMPVRDMYHMRPGYLRAFLLGVRHADERAGHDYNGPMYQRAIDLCPAALEAFDQAAKKWTA